MSVRRSAYILAALVGLVAAGLGLAGAATAAPTDPSPVSTAPASAGPAPVPVPVLYQPVDATDGLFGVRRGSVPTASTEDLSPVPIANQLPAIGVTPLPGNDESAADSSDTHIDEFTADADQ
jgi:hypothetical protein